MPTNLFFALELTDDARRAVNSFAQLWRKTLVDRADIRWYSPSAYHITLKFIGPRDPAEFPDLVCAGERAAGSYASERANQLIMITLTGAGAFPEPGHPSVLWCGAKLTGGLESLASHIDVACETIGVPAETRRFRPHITLARCHRAAPITLPAAALPISENFPVTRFVLLRTSDYKGQTTESNLRYNTVHTFVW